MQHAKATRSLCTGRCQGRGTQAFNPSALVPGLLRCQFCPLVKQAPAAAQARSGLPATTCFQRAEQGDRPPAPVTRLWTIGYERRSVAQLVAALGQAQVQVVVDVRWTAFSHIAAFCEEPLRRAMLAADLNYLHLSSLGSPPALRQRLEQAGTYSAFFDAYRQYLAASAAAQRTLAQLAELARERRMALLCRERDPHRCHRSVLAEQVAALAGLTLHHL